MPSVPRPSPTASPESPPRPDLRDLGSETGGGLRQQEACAILSLVSSRIQVDLGSFIIARKPYRSSREKRRTGDRTRRPFYLWMRSTLTEQDWLTAVLNPGPLVGRVAGEPSSDRLKCADQLTAKSVYWRTSAGWNPRTMS